MNQPLHNVMASSDNPASRPASRVRASSGGGRAARRIVTFLLGFWLCGIVLVAVLAPAAFQSVNQVMIDQPPAQLKAVEAIGPVATQQLLRNLAAQINGSMFTTWSNMQFGVSVLVFGLLLFGTSAGKYSLALSAFMTAACASIAFYVTPRIVELSRTASLKGGRGALSTREFQILHSAFSAFEIALVVSGAILLWLLFRRGRGASADF
jgi:hypothetical protein